MKLIIINIFLLIVVFPTLSIGKIHKIEMLNSDDGQSMVFKPRFLKIDPGDQIIFIPTDQGHNSQSVFTPEQATSWKGELSKETKITLKKEGLYLYECVNHSIMAMAGIIQVGKPSNLEKTKTFAKKYKKKFVMNKNRLDNILSELK